MNIIGIRMTVTFFQTPVVLVNMVLVVKEFRSSVAEPSGKPEIEETKYDNNRNKYVICSPNLNSSISIRVVTLPV